MLFRATILGPPRTKKTSNRVFFIGPRCPRCHRGETPLVKPSEAFEEWERMVAPQLREAVRAQLGGDAVCSRCDGNERDPRYPGGCVGCGGEGHRPNPIAELVHVRARVFRDAIRGDWMGYTQALADALETAGVVKNDELIKSWDGTRLLKDAKRPRVEVEIFTFDEVEENPASPQLNLLP